MPSDMVKQVILCPPPKQQAVRCVFFDEGQPYYDGAWYAWFMQANKNETCKGPRGTENVGKLADKRRGRRGCKALTLHHGPWPRMISRWALPLFFGTIAARRRPLSTCRACPRRPPPLDKAVPYRGICPRPVEKLSRPAQIHSNAAFAENGQFFRSRQHTCVQEEATGRELAQAHGRTISCAVDAYRRRLTDIGPGLEPEADRQVRHEHHAQVP